jgi:hypothetical protein
MGLKYYGSRRNIYFFAADHSVVLVDEKLSSDRRSSKMARDVEKDRRMVEAANWEGCAGGRCVDLREELD